MDIDLKEGVFNQNGVCLYCGMHPVQGEGKYLSLKQPQIEAILRHHTAPRPKLTQKDFCKQTGICISTYQIVTHLRVTHQKDKDKILSAATAIGYDMVTKNIEE